MKGEVLIGADAFMERFSADAAAAESRVFVQAMTFEGDRAGERLVEVMLGSRAGERRLCLDAYSKVVVNDRFVFSPGALFSADLQREITRGRELLKTLKKAGVGVKITNPVGPLLLRYPYRNHKKVVVCDDVVYLGGINFSDHNFEWHDMMVRLADANLAESISRDFLANFDGFLTCGIHEYTTLNNHQEAQNSEPPGFVYFLPGLLQTGKLGNKQISETYNHLFDHFRNAVEEIIVFSPYVSNPLLDILKHQVSGSVKIDIVTPSENNKSIFKKNMLMEEAEGYFNLYFSGDGMSHLKAALIDRKILIIGSSNYDFASYYFEEEIMISITNSEIINSFIHKVVTPARENCERFSYFGKDPISARPAFWQRFSGIAASGILRLIEKTLRFFHHLKGGSRP